MKKINFFLICLFFVFYIQPLWATSSVTTNPKTNYNLILNNSYTYTDQIPDNLSSHLKLYLPAKNVTLTKSQLLVKGSNKYLTDVFVNGQRIVLRDDGKFYYNFTFTKPGKTNLFISYITPDFEILNIHRKVLKLVSGQDNDQYPLKKQKNITYFCNTPYYYLKNSSDFRYSDPFTRADLAYFLAKLNNIPSTPTIEIPVFKDVSPNYWAAPAIQYVADQQIMTEYPDGTFQPDKAIKKMEYIIAITRALNHTPPKKVLELPYQDIYPNHWTAKYIKTALANNLIPTADVLRPQQDLSIADFALLVKNFPKIQNAIANLQNFNQDYEINPEWSNSIFANIHNYLEERKKQIAKLKKIEIFTPKNNSVIYEDHIALQGKIFPAQLFKINDQNITPNYKGEFSQNFTLTKPGRNDLEIQALDKTKILTLYYLQPYKDLQKHWFSATATKLKYLQITDNNQYFYPRSNISRAQLADILIKNFDLENNSTPNLKIKDVSISRNPTQAHNIFLAVENNILTLNKYGEFNPQKKVSRIEAITAIIRACNFDASTKIQTANTKTSFRDISSKHWAHATLKLALSQNLISPQKYFYPRKLITKAELFAIIARTPKIKKQLDNLFL
ncbi:S-layer homology domain-containing protein [bacterium]|jgi:hypothetical protein|nr:S-layer homology domain-containing protein [bacterium]MBT4552557.1 S-layer homology domain-containing protein [bacterium]MBT5989022.1 S-layer homology domain-containing protein [bacterium]MBT7087935.1 S-layer homology domain-containing protein [bacterium]